MLPSGEGRTVQTPPSILTTVDYANPAAVGRLFEKALELVGDRLHGCIGAPLSGGVATIPANLDGVDGRRECFDNFLFRAGE